MLFFTVTYHTAGFISGIMGWMILKLAEVAACALEQKSYILYFLPHK